MQDAINTNDSHRWEAQLDLRFAPNKEGLLTNLVHNRHFGPLVVQKALHPEENGCCHVIFLHPPSGIAGGDALALNVTLEAGAHALITTPGAGKFYGHRGRAEQFINLNVAENAFLEWLPQETLIYDASYGHNHSTLKLSADAAFIGWEFNVFGRAAFGENFTQGEWHNTVEIHVGDTLALYDPLHVSAGSRWFTSPLGLAHARLMGHCWLLPPPEKRAQNDAFIAKAREAFQDDAAFTITALDELMIARHHGDNIRHSFTQFEKLRALARREWFNLEENSPRIWRT